MNKFVTLMAMLLASFTFAEKVEIVYSSYILEFYNPETEKNGDGSEKRIQENGSLVVDMDNDSNMTVQLMNKTYYLRLSSYFTTVNEENDSVVVFMAYDRRDYQEYFLVAGPEYANFAKTKHWKINFETPQKLNKGLKSDGEDDYDPGIVDNATLFSVNLFLHFLHRFGV